MSELPADDLARITEYIGGDLSSENATPEAMAAVERWIAEDEGRRNLAESLRHSRAVVERSRTVELGAMDAGVDAVLRGVQAHMARRVMPSSETTPARAIPSQRSSQGSTSYASRVRWMAGLMAGALAVVGGVVLFQRGVFDSPNASSGSTSSQRTSALAKPETRYTTTTGQKATITLNDGSHVTLAPQTTLTVAADFGRTTRTVTVDGEAVFDVSAQRGAPFVVHAGSVQTRVLGTTFSVRRYAGDRTAQIAVMDGKLLVTATAASPTSTRSSSTITMLSSAILTAGMIGMITDSSVTSSSAANVAAYASWTQGRLVFHKAPVRDVLAAMQRWYGYEFRVTDSALVQQELTIGISTESARSALAVLKSIWEVEFVYQGNVVTVYPVSHGRERFPRPSERNPSPRMEVGR